MSPLTAVAERAATEAVAASERGVHRPVPPPPTRRQELRRAAAVQAAWLAGLR